MSINAVNSIAATATATQSSSAHAPPASKPTAAAASSKPVQDTVTLSSAAAALQEALESPAQTASEARGGDIQAQRLLAQEAAEKAAR